MRLTDEQREFGAAVDAFCRREAGSRDQRDALTDGGAEAHSDTLYRKLADLGYLGITIPEEFGGAAGDATDMVILLEHLIKNLAPVGGIGPTIITAAAYEKFGTDEQKKAILSGVVAGDSLSISMSEPGAGSDVGALTCKAERTASGWRVNGQKTWCSNAHFASTILLVARTSSDGGKHEGLTMFSVPAGTPGLTISGIDTLGGREVNDLYFTDCELPEDAVVGEVGQGWGQLMAGLNTERLILAAMQLGAAQRAFDDTLTFVTERHQFGRPVGSFQALRHRLADHATEIACTKLLVYDVAAQVSENPAALLPRQASMAKLKATETAKAMAIDGMQMMGGYGYATEFDMERIMRSSIISTVYGGTNEIQRDIIGKTYGL
ncbi:acyl-CoA dehydrogenase family protein [Williamsia maris]|uniref:Acyl-CoA dehydrogenase n=1 Tax=Williamsia maris TaxID=72806 RepID=A0ABT1HI60_9NOCA|nr:acyl-CoA dehydrogenase family protein [Williamsia maris]MCP2177725.1 Acyl-CoA dehydrogenase [Williamsia maris]